MRAGRYRSLSGERFLLRETLKVVQLILSKKSWNEIKRSVKSENIFGYRSENSAMRVLTAIKARLKKADEELLKIMRDDPHPEIINLYLMMKSNYLLIDFMKNVIRDKYVLGKKKLTERDIREYLMNLKCTSNWSEKTIERSGREIKNILRKSGILDDAMRIYRPILSNRFKEYILKKEGRDFLKLFGEGA